MVTLTQGQFGTSLQQTNLNNYPLTIANYGRNQALTPDMIATLTAGGSGNIFNLLNTATGNPLALPNIQQTQGSVMPGLFQAFFQGYPNTLTQPILPDYGPPMTNVAMGLGMQQGNSAMGMQQGNSAMGMPQGNSAIVNQVSPFGMGYYNMG